MQKHKIKGMVLALALVLGIGVTVSGCTLVTVNPERDNAQVIAEIDGQQILKKDFNNYMAYYNLYYEANGSSMPTDSDLDDMKQSVFDSLIQVDAMSVQAKKDERTIDDEEGTRSSAEESLNSLKEQVGDKYDSILSTYNTDEETLKAFMQDYMVASAYAGEAYTAHTDYLKENPDDILNTVVGKVGNEDVTRGEYYYYYFLQQLSSSSSSSSSTDIDTTNQEIFDSIAQKRAMIAYCEDNSIEITEESIESNKASSQSVIDTYYPDGEGLADELEGYFLTEDKFKEYQEDDAKGAATEAAIEAKLQEDAQVSDADVQKYYNENKDSYDESTVSAEHILTEDENLANEIYEAAKDCKSKEDFDKIIEQYKDNEQVKEATDLGSFDKSKMVTEFSDAAFGMDVNTVSEPVQTEYGYHVIFVYDKEEKDIPSLDDKRDEITTTLKQQQASEEFTNLQEDLLKDYKTDFEDIPTVADVYMEELTTNLNITTYPDRI